MSTPESDDRREERIAAILRATAELAAARSAHAATLAERLGLAPSDVEVLRVLSAEGSMPVGRIGELTGLTTGATTRLVDRLEQAGHVRRVPDPADRRRVTVEPVPDRGDAVARALAAVDDATASALDAVDDDVLAGIQEYLVAARAALDEVAAPQATAGPDEPASSGGSVAPIASATAGRLVFVTGAPTVRIVAAPGMGSELYRARFSGAIPSARVRDGMVTIRYPRFAWFDWRARIGDQFLNASAHWKRDRTELQLNASLAWAVEFRGGATAVTADLAAATVTGVTLSGGAGSVELRLGSPAGAVPIRLSGGAGEIRIRRDAGTAASLVVRGGARRATLDGEATWDTGQLRSPGFDAARDRFEIEISGGVNSVDVTAG